MEPNKKLTPLFFFLSLGSIITLIASVVSFLNLAFATLDKKFPDVLNAMYTYGYNTFDYGAIRSALATLIIIFPAFLVISYFWTKRAHGELSEADMTVKKWMLYILVFLSSIVILVDLVMLVRYFVAGEITGRFILKVAITLIAALMVGVYYILELKDQRTMWGFKVPRWGAIKASLYVLALIIFSFTVIGSPVKQRTLRLDDRRVQDLQSIQWQVINYWQQKEKLPAALSDLSNPLTGFALPVDPEMSKGLAYEYAVKGLQTFELCATFSMPMPKGWRETTGGNVVYPMAARDVAVSYPYPGPGGVNDSWDHNAGRTCFERTIDPDLYPPFPKPVKQ